MENLVTVLPQNLSGLNVLVTGGTGVIGAWLLKKLVEFNLNTTVLIWGDYENPELVGNDTLSKTNNIYGSLTDLNFLKSSIKEHEIDIVYHLGAQAIVETAANNPLTTFESNIRGTYNLLEACRSSQQNLKAIVVASSDKAYGTHGNLPYTETTSLNGIYPYEVSKSCTDLLSRSYAITYDMPIAIARCGNVYGGADLNWNRIVPGTINDLYYDRSPLIRSDGTHLRDYIYVKDIVDAYISLSLATLSGIPNGEAFNFGNNNPVSVLDLVDKISDLMGKNHIKPTIENSAIGEIHSQYLDSSKAKQMLNWEPNYSLEKGLTETIEWYTTFLSGEYVQNKH